MPVCADSHVCVLVCLYALGTVSIDKILHFINTLIVPNNNSKCAPADTKVPTPADTKVPPENSGSKIINVYRILGSQSSEHFSQPWCHR